MTSEAKDSLFGAVGPSGATVPHRFRTALAAPSSGCLRGLVLFGPHVRGDHSEDSKWDAAARSRGFAMSPDGLPADQCPVGPARRASADRDSTRGRPPY
jgi:hypothetical protein